MKNDALSVGQAIGILPSGDQIHTFYNPGFGLVGADWGRDEIIDKLTKSDNIVLTGPQARGMGHGLAAYNNGAYQSNVLFIETDEEKVKALEAEMEEHTDADKELHDQG